MPGQAKTAFVQSFSRSVEDGVPVVNVQVDAGGGELLTLDLVADAGEDAPPLPGDCVAVGESTGSGTARTAGFADPKNEGKALGGEKRIYARDPDTGEVVCEVWLKGPGQVAITALKSGADIELSTAVSGGKVIINGVEIDAAGNIKAPGDVTAMANTPAMVTLSHHVHPTAALGSPSPPTPGA